MSKSYEISTIKDLNNVVTKDNVELLKHDLSVYLDCVLATKELGDGVIRPSDKFVWNDDGVKGLKSIHLKVHTGKTND